MWRKTGLQIPIAVSGRVISHPDKYQIEEDTKQGWSSLIIDATRVTDAGYYTCYWLLNRTVVNSTKFTLVRKDKHFTLIRTSEKTVKASIGDDVELPCIVQRKHKYKVLWLDPSNRVVTFGSRSLRKRYTVSSRGHRRNWTLKITNVNKNDFGTFTCLVNTDPILSSTVGLSRKGYPPPRHTTTSTQTTTTQRHDSHSNVTNDICGNNTSICRTVSDSSDVIGTNGVPKLAAVHKAKPGQSWDRLILGTSIGVCGFVLFVGLASGCFLVDRIQKMTRRIIQQELTLDHMRMRRRSRRLTSETHVIIGRQNSSTKDNTIDSHNSGSAKMLKPKDQQLFKGTYCEPWSSSSDLIQAMNAAYTDQQGREDIQPSYTTNVEPIVEAAGKDRQEPPGGQPVSGWTGGSRGGWYGGTTVDTCRRGRRVRGR
ncbi:uncharacterized protein LOC124257047 [Haliotis rubra]|uniref:uncharacterized protein LOC124257047 n=1 Tax=Haliotis rubra TaxID=36100 RepID=UPI001EE53B51|nr:uncharacterized protein LOC124257047 [Haliotis rubra]